MASAETFTHNKIGHGDMYMWCPHADQYKHAWTSVAFYECAHMYHCLFTFVGLVQLSCVGSKLLGSNNNHNVNPNFTTTLTITLKLDNGLVGTIFRENFLCLFISL